MKELYSIVEIRNSSCAFENSEVVTKATINVIKGYCSELLNLQYTPFQRTYGTFDLEPTENLTKTTKVQYNIPLRTCGTFVKFEVLKSRILLAP